MVKQADIHMIDDIPVEFVAGRRGRVSPTWNDLLVLIALFKRIKPKFCLEVGIHNGNTARILLDRGPWVKQYVGIDREQSAHTPSAPPHAGELVAHDPRVELFVKGRGTRSIAREVIMRHGPFDWIFIDSDHSHSGTMFDTLYALPMLAPEGIMVWHDYGVPSQYRPGGEVFGVKRYLDECTNLLIQTFPDPLHESSIAFMLGGER